jgi:8-oxo-dGTP pyrophosphatase MutT (NUDIX family)|tara:strand:- start:4433 stop:4930 length:498 start_codon:yes stop_codon:yes gene_type:complete
LIAFTEFDALARDARKDNRGITVGALIANAQDQIFCQKRSATRSLFPNRWDIVGGHVDPGETLDAALRRETFEETRWRIKTIGPLVHTAEWPEATSSGNVIMREFDFMVSVEGDLAAPILECDKVTTSTWVDRSNLDILQDTLDGSVSTIYLSVLAALDHLATLG